MSFETEWNNILEITDFVLLIADYLNLKNNLIFLSFFLLNLIYNFFPILVLLLFLFKFYLIIISRKYNCVYNLKKLYLLKINFPIHHNRINDLFIINLKTELNKSKTFYLYSKIRRLQCKICWIKLFLVSILIFNLY